MRTILIAAFVTFMTITVYCQTVKNTSYINLASEKVLRLEAILPVDEATAWKLFHWPG